MLKLCVLFRISIRCCVDLNSMWTGSYTTEVKIDRRDIEVSNADSAQWTVINNTEFSGYYNEEKIFTLNKDETITKKTTVDGELTVGKTKFVPMPQPRKA